MLLCAIGAVVMVAAPLAAQNPTLHVDLGFASGSPGRTVTLPLSIQGAGGSNIRRVVVRTRFPAGRVSFVRLERAALIESTVELSAKVSEEAPDSNRPARESQPAGASDETRLLEVSVSSPSGGPLVDGTLAYLVFRIETSVDVEKTPEVLLKHDAEVFAGDLATAAPQRVAEAGPGKILIENPSTPIIACFYYMH